MCKQSACLKYFYYAVRQMKESIKMLKIFENDCILVKTPEFFTKMLCGIFFAV